MSEMGLEAELSQELCHPAGAVGGLEGDGSSLPHPGKFGLGALRSFTTLRFRTPSSYRACLEASREGGPPL